MNQEKLLTTREAAQFLRLNPTTLSAMARDGEIPAHKVGRRWRFNRARLEEMFAEKAENASTK